MNTKSHLAALEAESIHIIREVVAEFENPVMLYSIGKDSAVMLHLAMKAFYPGKPPFPIMHVDTLWKFREGSSKKPSFPRRRESSDLIFLGSRIRGNDESQVFRGTREMYAMRDQITEKHGLQLLVPVNEEGRAAGVNPFTHGSKVHTDVMETEGLKQAA